MTTTRLTDFGLPEDLSETARKIAEVIIRTAGPDATGGGCRAFYSAAEWRARGEAYGREALLVVAHDGGDLARFFNWDYEDAAARERMDQALNAVGAWAEPCTNWYTAIYPA